MPSPQANADQAHHSLRLVRDYGQNDMPTNVVDLLANLMHFCDREEIDIDRCMASARIHHEAEVNGEY